MASPKTATPAPKPPSPATVRYVLGAADTILGASDEDVTTEVDAGARKLSLGGVPYATYRIEGAELVLTVRKPRDTSDLEDHLACYRELPDGWLELRTEVTRNPRPWLAAGVGKVVGQTQFEVRGGPSK